MRLALALVLAGCGHDVPPPIPTEQRVATLAVGPCPEALKSFPTSRLWAHELFAGCSPPPFRMDGIACVGECPMPCSETIEGEVSTERWRNTFAWTDGRLATADGANTAGVTFNGKLRTSHAQCEYDAHGRAARCIDIDGNAEIHRDARGRIIEVADGDNALALTYDDAGNVIELAGRNGDSHLRYDDARRLITEETAGAAYHYTYDSLGRLVGLDLGQLQLDYDATTGLLADTVQYIEQGHGPAKQTVNITYDGRGRPIRIVSVAMPAYVDPERAADYGLIGRDDHAYSYVCSN